MKNYFQVLGLEESATLDEIKAAYRTYAKNFHPDKQNGNEFFKERFQEIQEAYEYLCQKCNNNNVIIQDAQLLSFYIELQNEGNYVLPNDCITIKYSTLHCTYTQLIIEDAEHMWQLDMPVCNYEDIYYLNLSKYEIKGNIKLKIKYGNSLCNGESKKIIDVFIATNYDLQEANRYANKNIFNLLPGCVFFIILTTIFLPRFLMFISTILSIWIDVTCLTDVIKIIDIGDKMKWYHGVGGFILFIVFATVCDILEEELQCKRHEIYNSSYRKRNQPPK